MAVTLQIQSPSYNDSIVLSDQLLLMFLLSMVSMEMGDLFAST